MMLIEWMSSSGAADEWEVLSSHLQYLRREISHITQWYLQATPLSVGAHRENTNGIPAAPRFSSLTLSFTALHCEANWKALSSLRLVLEWAVLRNLSYLLTAGLQQTNAPPPPLPLRAGAFSALPSLISDQVLRLTQMFNKGGRICPESSVIRRPQVERRLGPRPHILFELTTQAEWPVYNLHSRGRKPH